MTGILYPLRGLLTFRLGGSGVAALPPDLVAAVVARLRAQGVGAALGETAGVTKVWSDAALGSPGLPWLTVEEPNEALTPETPGDDGVTYYVGAGGLDLSVHAAGKLQARQLRALAVAALNDAPLAFADGVLLQFRQTGPMAPPAPGPAAGAAQSYRADAKFGYVVERTF